MSAHATTPAPPPASRRSARPARSRSFGRTARWRAAQGATSQPPRWSPTAATWRSCCATPSNAGRSTPARVRRALGRPPPATAGESICVGDAPPASASRLERPLARVPDGASGPAPRPTRTLAARRSRTCHGPCTAAKLRVVLTSRTALPCGSTHCPRRRAGSSSRPAGFALHRQTSDTFRSVGKRRRTSTAPPRRPWRVASHLRCLPFCAPARCPSRCARFLRPSSRSRPAPASSTAGGTRWDRATLVEGASPRAPWRLRSAATARPLPPRRGRRPARRPGRKPPAPVLCRRGAARQACVVHHGRRAVLLAGVAPCARRGGFVRSRTTWLQGPVAPLGTPTGERSSRATADGVLRVRDRATGETAPRGGRTARRAHLAVSPDGRERPVATERGDLARLDRATGGAPDHVFAAFGLHAGELRRLRVVSPDGRRVALSAITRDRVRAVEVDLSPARRGRCGTARRARVALGVAFTAEGAQAARVRGGDALHGRPRALACVELSTSKAQRARSLAPNPPDTGAGRPRRAARSRSRDGRLLWGVLSDGRDGVGFRVPCGPRRATRRRPAVARRRRGSLMPRGTERFSLSRPGTTLALGSSTSGGRPPRGVVRRLRPAGLAPRRQRALWVRDASGLVVEVSTSAAPRV